MSLRKFGDLFRIFLADVRDIWAYQLVFSLALPLGMVYLLRYVSGGEQDRETLVYLLSGNVISSLVFGTGTYLINRLGWARQNHQFDYWASLPVSKLGVLLAIVSVNALLSLPGVVGVLLLGSWLLQIPLTGTALIIPALLLAVLAIAAVAAFLGTFAKDGPTANMASNVLVLVVTFLSPVLIPAERMGAWVRYTSALLPTSYAARAVREVMLGRQAAALGDMAILAVMTAALLVLVQRKLDWRGER